MTSPTRYRRWPCQYNICYRIAIPEPEVDNRRSDFFIPNGVYSDLIHLLWCLVGTFLLIFGYWKSVFISFLITIFILKVVDVLGPRFGHNILRTDQEMSFYPLSFISISTRPRIIYPFIQHQDCHTVKLHTSKGIFLQLSDSLLVHSVILPTGGLGQCVAPGTDRGHLWWVY